MAIVKVHGDLLKSDMQTLVNTVNCVGVMGKGIALKFRRKYPEMYADYVERCAAGDVRPGEPYEYKLADGRIIVNFPTKSHWRAASQLPWVSDGLDRLAANASAWGLRGIAIPPLGCGNGGLDWSDVEPLMTSKLAQLDLPVELYVPAGTEADNIQLALDVS
jgi:O-acetyl-ADP-ribose deacetylase (regulator of RNase III)